MPKLAVAIIALGIAGVLYCLLGAAMSEYADRACRRLGYVSGGTDGGKAWTRVCFGERGVPPPSIKVTPLSDAMAGE